MQPLSASMGVPAEAGSIGNLDPVTVVAGNAGIERLTKRSIRCTAITFGCGKVQGIELLAHATTHLAKAGRLALTQALGWSLPAPGPLRLRCGADLRPVVGRHR